MQISYKKLWVLCADREISVAQLRKKTGLSAATFTKLRKNEEVTLTVMLKIAEVLQCNAGDMMDFIPEAAAQEKRQTAEPADLRNERI